MKTKHAFTLIELLVVLAVIGILAALLFPAFGMVREKARQSTCQSNLKQVMTAFLMYAGDNDEKMPFAITHINQIGPVTAAANGVAEFSVALEIMPYAKSLGLFHCPSDTGFIDGTVNTCGGVPCAGRTIAEAVGSSYRFAPPRNYAVIDADEGLIGPGDGTYTLNPPFPMPLSFFQRPTETRAVRCWTAPWEDLDYRKNVNIFHAGGMVTAFMDGHVKWVKSALQLDSYCDGPTWSPVRSLLLAHPNPNGDGSCGAERQEQ